MPRRVKDSPLVEVRDRKKLPPGLHWRAIDKEVHLGFRKGPTTGEWLYRLYLGNGKYHQERFAVASGEGLKVDGIDVVGFHDASKWACALAEQYRMKALIEQHGKAITVAGAIADYVAKKSAQDAPSGRKARNDILKRLTKHVLSNAALAERPLYTLDLADLHAWTASLDAELKATSRERIATDFKAALNLAAKNPKNRLPAEFRMAVKDGLAVDVRDIPQARDGQALLDGDVRKIVDAAKEIDAEDRSDGDLYRIVLVLAVTGARFSQARQLRVRDVQPEHNRIMMPVSKKGNGTKQRTHAPVPVDREVIEALRPIIEGRSPSEPLLERWYEEQVPNVNGMPTWERVERAAWRTSSQMARDWERIRERAQVQTIDGSPVVPYALRHSSIVRWLKQRIPTRVVAAVHDTSTAMIEKHYSSSILDTVDEMVAPAALSLRPASNLIQLPRKKRKAA